MLDVLFKLDLLAQVVHTPVHAHADIAGLPCVLENFGVLALLSADDRRHHLNARALAQRHHLIHDLIDGLLLDLFSAVRAVGRTDPRPQKAQIVVDLRHRTHRRTRILRGRFLIDGDGGGEAVDVVHVGLFLLPEKHPRVGRQAFHIPPLSLGIDGVKRQRAFSAAGQSRDDGQLVARDAQADILQIVFPRPFDTDLGICHGFLLICRFPVRQCDRADRRRVRIPTALRRFSFLF